MRNAVRDVDVAAVMQVMLEQLKEQAKTCDGLDVVLGTIHAIRAFTLENAGKPSFQWEVDELSENLAGHSVPR